MKNEEILEIIYESVDNINEDLPKNKRLKKSQDTVLYGKGGQLDSLSLVNLIVSIENLIEEKYDKDIILADEKAMSLKNSPFRTIKTLSDYIHKILD